MLHVSDPAAVVSASMTQGYCSDMCLTKHGNNNNNNNNNANNNNNNNNNSHMNNNNNNNKNKMGSTSC